LFYAQVDETGKVHTICDLAGETEGCISINSLDESLIGMIYNFDIKQFEPSV